jgi:hypothetical protein
MPQSLLLGLALWVASSQQFLNREYNMGLFDKPTFEARPAPNSIAGKIDAWYGNTYKYDDDAPVLPNKGPDLPPLTSIIDKYSSKLLNPLGVAPTRPLYAPEGGDLVGRFDGQIGFASTNTNDASSAVADAIIGNSVAAPVAASDAAPVAKESSKLGLMARRDEAATALYKERKQGLLPEAEDKVRVGADKNKLISNTLDILLTVESPRDHTDTAGNFTYAFGILPETARSLGFDRNATKANGDLVYPHTDEGRKDFAWNVYRAYLDNQEEIDPELWSSIDDRFKVGAFNTWASLLNS